MKVTVRQTGEDAYTVAGQRTLASEQLIAGFVNVPRSDIPRATELTVAAVRGDAVPEARTDWLKRQKPVGR